MTDENPFDIDEKASTLEEKEEEKKDGEEEGEGTEEMEEDKVDQQGEESGQETKTEEEKEEGGEKTEGDEESAEKDEEEDKQAREEEAGKDEELPTPAEKGHRPKVCRPRNECISDTGDVRTCGCVVVSLLELDCPQEEDGEEEEEEGADEDEEQPDSTERKEHDADGQTGEQSVQSDTAVELAGEASERDQAKEVVYIQHFLHLLTH